MKLSKLIARLNNTRVISYKETLVRGIACDSRKVKSGYIFVAIQGVNQDGNKFIKQVIKRGAIAVISQVTPKTLPQGIAWISCKDSRASLAQLAARFFGQPSKNMKVIGITGTNGKTTVSYLVEYLLKARDKDVAVIGTINYRFKNQKIPAQNTTPGPIEIQSFLARFYKIGIDYAVIEISSHALDQERVRHVEFSHAVFTNLSQDHLDYHHKMGNYFLAKSKLFKSLKPQAVSIINIIRCPGRYRRNKIHPLV
jgi:UDP-N-acetylmuramoyl-L-alanyl-D-glutamate--2,6-diaminopimelate ligase